MGFSFSASQRGHRSRLDVTPLVDVVLVLLIIFLVTAPLSLSYLTAQATVPEPDPSAPTIEPVRVNFFADGSIVIRDGATEVKTYRVNLARTLFPVLEKRATGKIVLVDVSDTVTYGDAVSVMDTIKGVGAEAISLAVNTELSTARK
ncbi:MAG: biopolymer transporter ExbD [Proteobacteria bacterium]|nr:biopolymer transporter ExbD [Pseudomonadota bacterium]